MQGAGSVAMEGQMTSWVTSHGKWLSIVSCVLWAGCASGGELTDDTASATAPGLPAVTAAAAAGAAAPTVTAAAPPTASSATGPGAASAASSPAVATAAPGAAAAAPAGAAAAAAEPSASEAAPGTAATDGVTYHKDIRPIMASNCSMACHGPDPALRTGPVALDTYASVKIVGALVVNAVVDNRMPPWPPDADCRDLRDTPSITPEQRDLFTQWQMAGFPEGNEADYVAPPVDLDTSIGAPSRIITMSTAHTPPPNTDEYTCGRGDYTFDKDTYIRAIEVLPDQKAIVHHVQIHVVSGNACTVGDNIYSWRPGGRRLVFGDGDGALIKAGSSFNFQLHYNTIGKTPTADKTQVAIWEFPEGKRPERSVTRVGVFGFVPILTPGAVQSSSGTMNVSGAGTEIIGVSPHAHLIAREMTANLKRAGGQTECLTKISDWEFEWQMDYLFEEPLPAMPGDTVEATCLYDNTVEHQPTVDGVKRTQPITVTAGEGTADEMCLHYIWLRQPVR